MEVLLHQQSLLKEGCEGAYKSERLTFFCLLFLKVSCIFAPRYGWLRPVNWGSPAPESVLLSDL